MHRGRTSFGRDAPATGATVGTLAVAIFAAANAVVGASIHTARRLRNYPINPTANRRYTNGCRILACRFFAMPNFESPVTQSLVRRTSTCDSLQMKRTFGIYLDSRNRIW